MPEVLAALHAILLGKSLKARKVAGIAVADLQALATKLQASKYAVLAWVAKDLDFPNAELAIRQITQIVATLNQTTRAAGLPLGGSDGDTSTNYTNVWLNGQILKTEETSPDAVVWVNSFNAEKLPQKSPQKNNVPLIVLGNANSQFKQTPDVFIPIATPGLDCSGTLFRVDGSVTLPLKKIRESDLPTLPEVIRQIEAAAQMITHLKNCKIIDPAHNKNGVMEDIYIRDGYIIVKPSATEKITQSYDLKGKVVMAGAIDMHSHIGGGKVNIARMMLPEFRQYTEPEAHICTPHCSHFATPNDD